MKELPISQADCMCNRRLFLRRSAEITGAMAMLSGAFAFGQSSTIPDKTGAVRVRLVYSIWDEVQIKNTWPNHGFDFRPVLKQVTDTLNAQVPGVEFIPGMAYDKPTADKILEEDKKAGNIDGYMVIQMNSWPSALPPILTANKPTLFCSFPYSGIGGWDVQNATCIRRKTPNYAFMSSLKFEDTVGVAKAFEQLKDGTAQDFVDAATKYRLDHTPAPSGIAPTKDETFKCLSTDELFAKTKGMKILALEHADKEFIESAKRDFGVETIPVKFKELNDLWFKVDTAKAQAKVDEWKKTAQKIEAVTDETLLGVAKMSIAMDELVGQYNAQAITINCLTGCYQNQLSAYPCLGFMELQDKGLVGACECDLRSTLTMLVFSALTNGRPGYISDPALDSSRRAIVYAHCVAPRRFFGPESEPAPFEILTHSEDRQGASVRSIAPVGSIVTTLLLWPQIKHMIIHQGRVIGNDPDDRACRTKIVAEIPENYERMYTQWDNWGWHRVTFFGDFKEQAIALANKLGYYIVYEDGPMPK